MRFLTICVAALVSAVAVEPAAAHHAFGAEFDANRPVLLKGKIVRIEWVNPHTWIHIEVTKADGVKEVWMVEGGSPNSLLRRGANKNTFPEGTAVVVDGYQARDHSVLRANARNVTFPDGRKLFLGCPGTGAPDDKPADKDKSDKDKSDKDKSDKDKSDKDKSDKDKSDKDKGEAKKQPR